MFYTSCRPPTSTVPLILESEKLEEDDEYELAQEKATQGLFETLGENLVCVLPP